MYLQSEINSEPNEKLRDQLIVWLDYLLLYRNTDEKLSHSLARLLEFWNRLSPKLQREKCVSYTSQVSLSGKNISPEGILLKRINKVVLPEMRFSKTGR